MTKVVIVTAKKTNEPFPLQPHHRLRFLKPDADQIRRGIASRHTRGWTGGYGAWPRIKQAGKYYFPTKYILPTVYSLTNLSNEIPFIIKKEDILNEIGLDKGDHWSQPNLPLHNVKDPTETCKYHSPTKTHEQTTPCSLHSEPAYLLYNALP